MLLLLLARRRGSCLIRMRCHDFGTGDIDNVVSIF